MVVKEHRWPALDASTGEVVAYHVRVDLDEGGKRIWWEDTEGNKGLPEGIKVADLGLYRMDEVKGADEIVLVEGATCADALKEKSVSGVGTICGASVRPSDDALRPLVQSDRIVLWPDNDDPGRMHMTAIGRRLHHLDWQRRKTNRPATRPSFPRRKTHPQNNPRPHRRRPLQRNAPSHHQRRIFMGHVDRRKPSATRSIKNSNHPKVGRALRARLGCFRKTALPLPTMKGRGKLGHALTFSFCAVHFRARP